MLTEQGPGFSWTILFALCLFLPAYFVWLNIIIFLILPYFPWVDKILNAMVNDAAYLMECVKNSLILLFTGYFTGVILGLITGIACGYSKKINYWVAPFMRLIEMVGLDDFRDSYPHQLSGGMAQRVALIRTMVNKPDVFLLDEPLGALDAFTRMNMQDELISMWQDNRHIMIMVTHDVDEAVYISSKVIVMAPRPGRISKIFDIDMPYPRNRTSEAFTDYRNQIMNMLDFGKEE